MARSHLASVTLLLSVSISILAGSSISSVGATILMKAGDSSEQAGTVSLFAGNGNVGGQLRLLGGTGTAFNGVTWNTPHQYY